MESSNQEHEKLPLGCKCSSSSEESSSMAVNYEEDDDTIHRVASFPTSLLRLQQEDYKIDAPHSPLSSNHRDITRANCRLVKYGSLHRRNYRRRRGMKNSYWIITTTVAAAAAVIVSSLLFLSPTTVHAALSCETDEDCETILRPGSTCLESTKTCSNPFQRGCFKTLLPEDERFHMGRICNSDDDDIEVDGSGNDVDRLCYQPDFIYDEIRVHNGNWESSIFLSWIMQILLMEVVQVPVTVGLTLDSTKAGSFYSEESTLPYSAAGYPWDALEEANNIGDCRLAFNETRQCIHVMPEVWNGQKHEWIAALQGKAATEETEEDEESEGDLSFTGSSGGGYIDPIEGNGQVGKGSWYVPSFAADSDDSLVSFYGLRGEENRHKLADAFRRPTTWMEYCEEISDSNCTEPDGTAARYPSEEEEESYFAGPGSYVGYFRLTEANNCTLNPTTCVGHIIGPPCTWSTNVDGQLYWNNIVGIAPDGPVEPNGGYNYGPMIEIWRAANWTKSNVMFWWWRPDALVEEFHGTDAQFQQVLLPEATDICSRSRVDTEARCSEDIMERRGSPEGACDQEAHALQKIFAKSLRERTLAVNPTLRSPGYTVLQNLKITDLEVNNMIRRWLALNTDRYGNDAREAVCGWMVENMDAMLDFIPQGYPRVLSKQSSYDTGYLYAAQAVASFTVLVVLVSTAFTFFYRKTKVFVFAQVYFCWLILFGFFLICIGSIVTTLNPSRASCTARVWLITLGYTIELVPLLVKIAAINSILQSAKKMRRVQISPKNMMLRVAVVVVAVTAYLLQWTIWDTPSEREYFRLKSEQSPIVLSSLACSSERFDHWYLITLGWQSVMLIMASVLAYQSRTVLQEFNESRSLGTMAYSHFLFVVLRTILLFLGRQPEDSSSTSSGGATFEPNVVSAASSFLLSLDALFAMTIYILPKFMEAKVSPEVYDPKRGQSVLRNSVATQGAARGGMPSAAMSNISMIESRAAAARQSITRSGIFSDFGGPSGESTKKAHPSRDGDRSWLFKLGGSGGGSMQSSSDSTPFDSPSSGKRSSINRISQVKEVSCETTSEHDITSRPLSRAPSSQRKLNVADEDYGVPFTEEPLVEENNEDEEVEKDSETCEPELVGGGDVEICNEETGRASERVEFDRDVPLRLSSLKSIPQLDSDDPEMIDGHNSMGSVDSTEEHDIGGPQWSKPELNVQLNRSCRTIDPHGKGAFSGGGRGGGLAGRLFNRSSPSLSGSSKRSMVRVPSFTPVLPVIRSPKPSSNRLKNSAKDSCGNDSSRLNSSSADVSLPAEPKVNDVSIESSDVTGSQHLEGASPLPPSPKPDSEDELTLPPQHPPK